MFLKNWKIKRLIKKMKNKSRYPYEKRMKASKDLADMGGPIALNVLIDILLDSELSDDARCSAAYGLRVLNDPQGISPLVQIMTDDAETLNVRKSAVMMLSYMGWKPDEPRQGLAYYIFLEEYEKFSQLGVAGMETLIALFETEGQKLISSLPKDEFSFDTKYDSGKCAKLREGLKNIRDINAVPLLIYILNRNSEWQDREDSVEQHNYYLLDCHIYKGMRIAAAQALGAIRDARGIPSLLEAILDDQSEVRKAAAQALSHFDELGLTIKDKVRLYIATGESSEIDKCVSIGSTAVEFLIEALEKIYRRPECFRKRHNENEFVQRGVIRTLGVIGDRRAIKPLRLALYGGYADHSPTRAEAIRALGKLGDQQLVDDLLKVVTTHKCFDPNEYEANIDALGDLGDQRAIEPLRKLAEDKTSSYTRHHAKAALSKLESQQTVSADKDG